MESSDRLFFSKNLPPKRNLKLLSARRSRAGFGRGWLLAAAGGEMRPNYFKDRPLLRTADRVTMFENQMHLPR